MPTVEEVVAQIRAAAPTYLEVLRFPSLSAGVYVLPAPSEDRQSPHGQDEVYLVVRGRGRFRQGERDRPVGPGDLLYVPALEVHRFYAIEEELVLFVVFAPPESPPR